MTEKSLSDAVDRLALSNAKAFGEMIQSTVRNALKAHWHVHNEWTGEYVKAIVTNFIANSNHSYVKVPDPPEKIVAAFRVAVLEEVLTKLPLVKQLEDLMEAPEQ